MNYNKLKYIIVALAVFILGGCNDDFLETINPNTVGTEQFWQTTADFNSGLAAAYAALQFDYVTGSRANIYERIRTDLCRSFSFYSNEWAFMTFTHSNTEPFIGHRWKELYVGIFRTNQIMDNLAMVTPEMDISTQDLQLIEGQTRFLRALLYFWVANSYGGALIHESVPKNDEELQGGFSDRSVVISDLVIPDLLIATQYLPDEWDSEEDLGRATSGAARSLLGKVYLYDEQFVEAAAYFDTVINSGVYSLVSNINDNFNSDNEHNSESIFEVGFNENILPGVSALEQEALSNGAQSGQTTPKATFAAPQSLGGLRVMVPTFWATELFMKDSLDRNIITDTTRHWSDRTHYSIAFALQDGDYYLQPVLEGPDWFNGGAECAYWKKYTNWENKDSEESWTSTMRSGINERIIRFADVKLMYAEAILRKNGSTSSDVMEALNHVDDIRERAGVITLLSYIQTNGELPQYHLRGNKPFSSPGTLLNNQSLLTHIQMVERPLELAFEGNSIRWHDLRRWNMVSEVLAMVEEIDYTQDWMIRWIDDDLKTPVFPSEYRILNQEADPDFLDDAINLYQNHQADNYNSSDHDFLRIPLDEINTNDNIKP